MPPKLQPVGRQRGDQQEQAGGAHTLHGGLPQHDVSAVQHLADGRCWLDAPHQHAALLGLQSRAGVWVAVAVVLRRRGGVAQPAAYSWRSRRRCLPRPRLPPSGRRSANLHAHRSMQPSPFSTAHTPQLPTACPHPHRIHVQPPSCMPRAWHSTG